MIAPQFGKYLTGDKTIHIQVPLKFICKF
jgi:hypothetical protein